MLIVIQALAVGACAGLLGSLLGVGGGILLVPAFIYLMGMDTKVAIATSMAVIVVTSLSATVNNATDKDPLIDWKIALIAGATAVIAAWLGSDLMKTLSNQALTRAFGVVLILAGIRALVKA